jgi:hypothetical protein
VKEWNDFVEGLPRRAGASPPDGPLITVSELGPPKGEAVVIRTRAGELVGRAPLLAGVAEFAAPPTEPGAILDVFVVRRGVERRARFGPTTASAPAPLRPYVTKNGALSLKHPRS